MYSFLVPSLDFDVTPDFLIDKFVVLYSEAGHNNRTKEESINLSWCEYIMECNGKEVEFETLHIRHVVFILLSRRIVVRAC